jgi:hypothetical protein
MPFICDVCNYLTNRKSNLTQHQNRKKPCVPSKQQQEVLCTPCVDSEFQKVQEIKGNAVEDKIKSKETKAARYKSYQIEAERQEIINLTKELEEVRRGIRVKVNDTTTTTNEQGEKETVTSSYVTNLSEYIKMKPEFRQELLGYIDMAEQARANARRVI